MLKKFAILGSVLLLAGTVALGWVIVEKKKEQRQLAPYKLKYGSEPDEYIKQYNEWLQLAPEERAMTPWGQDESGNAKTEAQLQNEQQERLKADLDKLAAGEIHPFADILYGENWQNELSKYKEKKELREFILTCSIACTFAGGAIFTCCLLLWSSRLFLSTLDGSPRELFINIIRGRKNKNIEAYTADSIKVRKNSEAFINPGRQNYNTDFENHKKSACEQVAFSPAGNTESDFWNSKRGKEHSTMPKISVLLSDEKSSDTEKTVLPDSHKNSLNFEDALNTQTETLEKQMDEFRQLAQNIQQAALEHSNPLKNALGELMQQVSAIREYAAYQQDRVEKLQDGYDWNIIRTFCLRVIRCIDNLESRISRLSEKNIETLDLKEVRDELLFALESSGVEQFELGVNSDYRGQEKFAEAVKEKQQCDDPKQAGKIAQVIRPGYQYFINDENIKVVRTAQVKLFG